MSVIFPIKDHHFLKIFYLASLLQKSLYFKSSAYYEKNQIDILLNNNVTSINRTDKNIALKNGSKFYYKKLVIATGSKLNKLDLHCDKEDMLLFENYK